MALTTAWRPSGATSDDEGLDLPHAEAAREAALAILPDMARDKMPGGNQRVLSATVRDDGGTVIYSATLSLRGG